MERSSVQPPSFDLDIGLIYTHERQYMSPLVSSLARSGDGLQMRLILVDNASDDGIEPWSSIFAHTKVIRNRRRLPYASNLNRILAASKARYTLLLNTDMYFDPAEQCLAKMVPFMDDRPECGVSGCRIYQPNGNYAYPARRFQTIRSIVARRFGWERLLGGTMRHYLYLDRSPYDVFSCDWLSGCFMLVRREAISQTGAFDFRFRKYFEDVDLCARMSHAGWQVMFNGATFCYHFEQRASKQFFSKDALQHLRSYLRWTLKWGIAPPRASALIAQPGKMSRQTFPGQQAKPHAPHMGTAHDFSATSVSAMSPTSS